MKGVETLDDLLRAGVAGKRVFVRADLNVPLRAGVVRDDSRIRASIPTIQKLVASGAKVILASHLGRPKGRVVDELSLRPVADRLRKLTGSPVVFASACRGTEVEDCVAGLPDGGIVLLENLRFDPGEESDDREFSRDLAKLCDFYVFDAFGTAHRAHASTVGILEFVDRCVVGELVHREIEQLESLRDPSRPFVCILGGAKVSGKAGLLEALVQRADVVALGGAMAYPFLDWTGHCVGKSPVDADMTATVEYVLNAVERMNCQLLLPTDHRVLWEVSEEELPKVVKEIPVDATGVDIGPATADRYARLIEGAGSVFWNGPMGIIELPGCGQGTEELAHAVARCSGFTVVGGGETVEALRSFGVENGPDHVSMGGAAALEFVAGTTLPALAALVSKRRERKEVE